MPMAFLINVAVVASTATGLSGSLRLPSRVTVAAMSSARSSGCNLKPSSNRVLQGRFRGSRLDRNRYGHRFHPRQGAPRAPCASGALTMFTAWRNRKAAQRGTLGENNEF